MSCAPPEHPPAAQEEVCQRPEEGEEGDRVTVRLEEQESELVFLEAVEEGEQLQDCHCVLVVFSVTDTNSLRFSEQSCQPWPQPRPHQL